MHLYGDQLDNGFDIPAIIEVREVTNMTRIRWEDHIIITPDVHHGDPCIKGTRVPVATIVGSLADGMSPAEIQAAYPQLTSEDIQAALAYAADVVRHDILAPLAA
jgi:uncharacterized protein (DUF433 family)